MIREIHIGQLKQPFYGYNEKYVESYFEQFICGYVSISWLHVSTSEAHVFCPKTQSLNKIRSKINKISLPKIWIIGNTLDYEKKNVNPMHFQCVSPGFHQDFQGFFPFHPIPGYKHAEEPRSETVESAKPWVDVVKNVEYNIIPKGN